MISLTSALQLIAADPLGSESVPLDLTAGRILSQHLVAEWDQPPFDAAAMDGYALRADPTCMHRLIVGESAAGHPFHSRIDATQCVRISTGAALPAGADAVILQEDADTQNGVLVSPAAHGGVYVRPRASDFAAGDVVLRAGTVLSPGAVTLAAATGAALLRVRRQPRIAVVSIGDELVTPGATLERAQIFDSASYGVATLAGAWGAVVKRHSIVPDTREAIASAMREVYEESDVIVSIGGASAGPHDHVRAALDSPEFESRFSSVAIKPGKPTWFGYFRGLPLLGLPGNPASALVCARLFLCPLIEKRLGRDDGDALRTQAAFAAEDLDAGGTREEFVRAIVTSGGDGFLDVRKAGRQDSSLSSSLAASNALVWRPAVAPQTRTGEPVPFLSWLR